MFSLFSKFKNGLQKTATSISRTIGGIFSETQTWDAESFTKLEKTLLEADFGPATSKKLVADLKDRYDRGILNGSDNMIQTAIQDLSGMLKPGIRSMNLQPKGALTVILVVGVNGSGKTTSIGKLAHLLQKQGHKVMLAACDTFRAAAVEQLKLWGERNECPVVSSKPGADPSAVAYDAIKSALAKQMDVLLIDTAGRQQNKKHLMDELAKMRRTIEKLQPNAPHETILTIDASIGLNAISQAREFAAVSGTSALILTKLDGTGKGGAAAAVQEEFKLPILFVGLGEGIDDLQPFDPDSYASAVFGKESSSITL